MPTDYQTLTTWLKSRGENEFPFDPATDGELRLTLQENGDLVVECGEGDTYHFRKYPTA